MVPPFEQIVIWAAVSRIIMKFLFIINTEILFKRTCNRLLTIFERWFIIRFLKTISPIGNNYSMYNNMYVYWNPIQNHF